MEVLKAIKTRLNAYTALTDLVSNRIYHKILPQNPVYPAVTYYVVSNTYDWAMGSDTGLQHARVQVSAFGADDSVAADAATQVKAALKRWTGTAAGVTVQAIFMENEFDFYDPETEDWQFIHDYMVHYR